jgi:hypothetical protein
MKVIKTHNEKCLSVRCDFYQTCVKNSVSHTYKTKRKFVPLIVNQTQCFSFDSGKQSNLRDNNYPHKLIQLYDYHLYPAETVVDFV